MTAATTVAKLRCCLCKEEVPARDTKPTLFGPCCLDCWRRARPDLFEDEADVEGGFGVFDR